jgi:hypothetical protein
MNKMVDIQEKLKAPKSQFNSFGKYAYRSCEDIVEAVKPVLREHGYHLILTDDVVGVLDRVYVKATATVMNGGSIVASATAYAREPEDKKGMDSSQITGTASSYARKYALNGLFAIDDTKDADTNEHKHQADNSPAPEKPVYDMECFNNAKAMMQAKIDSGERTTRHIIQNLTKTHIVPAEVKNAITNLGNQEQEA